MKTLFSFLGPGRVIALILFYTFMPLVGLKFPGFARWTVRIFSVILALGLLVVGVTEAPRFALTAPRYPCGTGSTAPKPTCWSTRRSSPWYPGARVPMNP